MKLTVVSGHCMFNTPTSDFTDMFCNSGGKQTYSLSHILFEVRACNQINNIGGRACANCLIWYLRLVVEDSNSLVARLPQDLKWHTVRFLHGWYPIKSSKKGGLTSALIKVGAIRLLSEGHLCRLPWLAQAKEGPKSYRFFNMPQY